MASAYSIYKSLGHEIHCTPHLLHVTTIHISAVAPPADNNSSLIRKFVIFLVMNPDLVPLEQVALVALVVALVAREPLLARLGLLVGALVSSEAALCGEGLKGEYVFHGPTCFKLGVSS